MNEITWKLDMQVKDGPKFNLTDVIRVESYNKIDVEIPPLGDLNVHMDCGDVNEVQFLLITRIDKPDPPQPYQPIKRLLYTVDDGNREIVLESHHLLIGPGVMNLLEDVPEWLHFHNEQAKNALVTILLGRKVPPPSSEEDEQARNLRNLKLEPEDRETQAGETVTPQVQTPTGAAEPEQRPAS